MKYTKPPLTFQQQADLLIARGLIADRTMLIERLQAVNYYRLSGYLYPFKNPDNRFKPGTTLEEVWQRYTFDRQLRLLVLDAIERTEVAIRTHLIYQHAHAHGAFGYMDRNNLPNLNPHRFNQLQRKLREAVMQSKDRFVEHFQSQYGDQHRDLPLWMLAELMSFGMMFTFFRGVDNSIKRQIATEYGLRFRVLESWLHSLNAIRNICAHHSRLWNRILGIKPLIPSKDQQWHQPIPIPNDRIFGILALLRYLLKSIAPQSHWPQRLVHLLDRYPDIPRQPMGFPEHWQSSAIWKTLL